jgi:uncharacterized protein YydD (DUF2326 family)
MIRSITCDQKSFRPVHFKPGFNIVLADRTKDSTRKDSRNGLGKSTLIEIIHFCLGSEPRRGESVLVPPLAGWAFTLELELDHSIVTVSRNTSEPKFVSLEGSFDNWPIKPKLDKNGQQTLVVKDWTVVLGHFMFGIPPHGFPQDYAPNFRSLIPYFVRRGRDAFSLPFEHHRKQFEWDKQINNAFLLDLAWEDASEWQELRDKKKHLDNLRAASKAGIFREIFGSSGELEAEKIRLEGTIAQNQIGLNTFNVHPQYREIELEALALTQLLHSLGNKRFQDERRLAYFEQSLTEEKEPDAANILQLYEEAGVALPGSVTRRLDEVQRFHEAVIENRKSFLAQETAALERSITMIDAEMREKDEARAKLMATLKTHGPWEEYSQLQQRQSEAVGRLHNLNDQIERIKLFEEGRSALRIEAEVLRTKARQDYATRSAQRQRAVQIFNANSEVLYEAPGNLVIDVTDSGYKFNIEIQRSGSSGVGNMKVFCYDLLLAELWAKKMFSPGFLVHDSLIFEGVDERQHANALILAATKSVECGFQYICTMNTDSIPAKDASNGLEWDQFKLREFVRLTLTDQTAEGSLLGIRF